MVLAALAFSPETFAVGADIFGVTNWIRFLESIPPQWGALRQSLFDELGDPNKDREMLRATSPLFHADKIRKPLLVLQGANDPRAYRRSNQMRLSKRSGRTAVRSNTSSFPMKDTGLVKRRMRFALTK